MHKSADRTGSRRSCPPSPRPSPPHTAPSASWMHELPKLRRRQWSSTAAGGARNASLTAEELRKEEACMRSAARFAEPGHESTEGEAAEGRLSMRSLSTSGAKRLVSQGPRSRKNAVNDRVYKGGATPAALGADAGDALGERVDNEGRSTFGRRAAEQRESRRTAYGLRHSLSSSRATAKRSRLSRRRNPQTWIASLSLAMTAKVIRLQRAMP